MNRLLRVWTRHGWRTPFVAVGMACERFQGVRGWLHLGWLRFATRGRKGRNIWIGKSVSVSPGGHLDMEGDLYIGERCSFIISVAPRGRVSIGTNTWLSRDCLVGCNRSVHIGSHVLIGEFVSIRDSTHSHANVEVPIKGQGDILGTIRIEDDVWIGRGCLIQGRPEGITIGSGSIVGANSVVSRSIPPMQVWGGVPARFIKNREGKAGAAQDSIGT